MPEIEIFPQKIVDTRTVILRARLDSNTAKLQGEQLKNGFFVRFGFLRPKRKDVLLVDFNQYYEPYILIGGKYSINYCKRHNYALKVEDRTQTMYIDGKKMKPEPLSLGESARVIKLVGEEHSHYENATYVVLDRLLQEVPPERLFFAPFESQPVTREAGCFDLRKPHITLEEEIAVIRSRVAKRPSDVAEIIREIFEITERAIIYSPIYELTYKNLKNGKNVTALINGITGEVILGKFDLKTSRKLRGNFNVSGILPAIQSQVLQAAPEPLQQPRQVEVHGDTYASNSAPYVPAERLAVENRVSNAAPAMQQRTASTFRSNAGDTTHLATDFLARLGYSQDQFPTKLYVDGETKVVELQLQQGTARLRIDRRTKRVKA